MKHIVLSFLLLIITPSFAQQKKKSIGFIENKGQITDQNGKPNPAVQFLLNTDGLNVQIKKHGFSYDIYEVIKKPVKQRIEGSNTFSSLAKNDNKTPDYTLEYVFHRVDIDFVNSNPNVELVTAEASKDYDNYYNVPNKPEGVVNVHLYQQITYKNIYPNIDVVFFVPKDTLKTVEYNFVVHPKGKISDIQMKFNGVKTDLVDNKIQMNVRFGKMEETLPASWREEGEIKRKITVGYKKIKNNIYGFETANAISNKTVIIDPVPVRLWGTYYAGNNSEYSTDICNDKNNNVYFSGYTSSTTNIATSGSAPVPYYYNNGFIVKFDSNGTRIWGVYYSTTPSTIKVDSNENLYFTGETWGETNVSTPGSHQPLHAEYDDAYLVKLNSFGIREWGTYYGGFSSDKGNDISFDNDNNVYLVGVTSSYGNIATNNTHQPTHALGYLDDDGFIAKFTTQGVRVWGSYFGGTDGDQILSSNISDDGFLYITGNTRSTAGISTSNSYQPNMIGYASGMISKFTLDGQRIWGTYFNGNTSASITKSKIKNNLLYFTGITNSRDNLNSNGTFNENYIDLPRNFGFSSYISKFDLTTQSLVWGTYFGEFIQDLKVNSNNKVFVTGCTDQDTGIATTGSFSSSRQRQDAYLIKLNEIGQREWGTYYGGDGNEGVNGAADVNNKMSLDQLDNIYLVGNTTSTTGISTAGAHQENYMLNSVGGLNNIYLAKFQDCLSNPLAFSNSPICISNTIELNASGGTNYTWTGPNGFTSTLQNPTILNATTLNSGEYRCLITGTGGCDDTKTVAVIVGDIELPIPDSTTLPTLTGDCNTVITTIPTATDSCAGTITATTASALSYSLPGTYTVVWNYNDGNGNTATQNQTVTITPQPLPTATSPQTFCIQENATINDIIISGQNIKWYDSLTNGSLLSITTSLQNGNTYYASQTINSCESERIPVLINIQNTLAPTGNANQTFCSSQNPTLDTVQISGTSIKWYNSSGTLLSNSTSLQNGMTYYATQTINTCESERIGITISIVNTPATPTANANQNFCKKENARLSAIQIAGQDLNWYETNFSAISLPNSTLLENNKSYYASQTIGCESDRIAILIRIYDTPPPTGNTNQQFCIDENAQISNLNILGSNIKWYDALTNGTALAETTVLSNGVTYYATQTLNDCESEKIAITVTIQDTQIPIGNPNQTFCIQENTKISNIAIEGQNIKWYTSLSSLTTLSESIVLENEMTYYASQTINNCESLRTPITVNILEATNAGCLDLVDELPYPKFFTPNGDGFNDTWTINFAYLKPNTGIKIFDRYGKLITVLNQNETWNGTYNNQQLPATDYWFIATRADGKEDKGHFSLKR
ncbi:DUF7948 domain-containing protein [Flavobacterium xanthum]|uniref:Gliding motility-associated C-terminal domain-containing protein n=1 Tax=Flavobacterium xanthum TaxID=69322 RepID=A0A1M7JUM1_9FLAO|nr:T9SS type B sorting domain-containing protein [Flavobacterium xanthum]SHM56423.1 gliding motility-associated C-terminal domain-containing protein [Flavobacterium xanthum]